MPLNRALDHTAMSNTLHVLSIPVCASVVCDLITTHKGCHRVRGELWGVSRKDRGFFFSFFFP